MTRENPLQFPSNFLWGCATAVKLLKDLGAKAYRFSFSWSRVFPDAVGKPNQKGVNYYQRVVDELLQNGIEPYVTLFHWDLPQALPGGWQSRDTPKAMAGQSRSELKLGDAEVNQIRHHGILAHGLSVQAIRANAQAGTQVGLAENAAVFVPVIETKEHIEAAQHATREGNAPFLTAVLEGKYTDQYLEKQGKNAPNVQAGDMEAIGSPLDFVGLNVYTPEYVRAGISRDGYSVLPRPAFFPRMASPWLYVGPEVIYWAIRNVSEVRKPKEIYITENGCSSEDVVTKAGRIEDTDRVMYLRNHFTHLRRAAAEGYPIKGYFLWSLLDNFEWADGYSKRFGIHYVDFKTGKRTPRLSAEWYREVIARNAVV